MKYKIFSVAMVLVLILISGCASIQSAQQAMKFETAPAEKGDLSAFVVANGVVRPARQASLSWSVGGRAEVADLTIGDAVRQDQELARIAPDCLPQSLVLAQVDVYQAQQQLDALLNNEVNRAQAQLNMVQAQSALEKAERKRRQFGNGQRQVAQLTLDSAQADVVLAEEAVANAQRFFDMVDDRPASDPQRATAQQQLAQAIQQRNLAQANLSYLTSAPSSSEVALADAELALAQAQLLEAQRAYERIKDGAPADELAAAQARLQAAQMTLEQQFLLAPFDGVITDRRVEDDDWVTPGSLAFQLEDRSHWFVDVAISEIDINFIEKGTAVQLSFDAVPGREYQGEVVQVGLSGERAQGVVNYPVVIEVLNPDSSIRSGMTVLVRIQTQHVQDVLLVPNSAVRILDGERVVFVQRGAGLPQPVKIQLGISSETHSQVLSGDLQVGDAIVLNPDSLMQMQNGASVGVVSNGG
ncbi:MAG: efflux RND transporter periplasmic adaptor subunit [Anaerolinea sp.]|nr:efflux RND transporter periplasmic adaptor subunit [Anaerolinea sp.]